MLLTNQKKLMAEYLYVGYNINSLTTKEQKVYGMNNDAINNHKVTYHLETTRLKIL